MRMCCSGCSAALQLQRALYVLASWTAIRCFAAGADIGDYNVCKLLSSKWLLSSSTYT
jgi:hypothetical protein